MKFSLWDRARFKDSGGSGGGGSQTITQTTQIPQYLQDFAKNNTQIATSLAKTPYPTYQGQMIAGFSPLQQQAIDQTGAAAGSYQPDLAAAEQLTMGAANPGNPQNAAQFMSPYVMGALQPQVQALQQQQAQNQLGINKGATQAGAFGDARHGVADALNNFYGNLSMNDLLQQGFNQAWTTGQQNQLAAGNQLANLGAQQQNLGLQGVNSLFGAGTQEQQLQQSELSNQYNQFINQVQWPYQQLNMLSSVLSGQPYNLASTYTTPPANAMAQNLGAFGALAGGLGSLLGGTSKAA